MTKKDYQLIADVINRSIEKGLDDFGVLYIDPTKLIDLMGTTLKNNHPAFDPQRFSDACWLGGHLGEH
jgi:hypothetical protein